MRWGSGRPWPFIYKAKQPEEEESLALPGWVWVGGWLVPQWIDRFSVFLRHGNEFSTLSIAVLATKKKRGKVFPITKSLGAPPGRRYTAGRDEKWWAIDVASWRGGRDTRERVHVANNTSQQLASHVLVAACSWLRFSCTGLSQFISASGRLCFFLVVK